MLAFLRFLAGVFLIIAVIAGVSDASAAKGALAMTSLGEHWSALAPATLNAAQGAAARYLHPAVWQMLIQKLLLLPTSVVFGVLGLLLAYAGRRRRRVNIFAN
jgi:hypothetical protein